MNHLKGVSWGVCAAGDIANALKCNAGTGYRCGKTAVACVSVNIPFRILIRIPTTGSSPNLTPDWATPFGSAAAAANNAANAGS